MPTEYDPKLHEIYVVDWWLRRLAGDVDERNRLFHSSLHSITKILWWASHDVKLAFERDDDGLWAAAWLAPYMSGAECGAWFRKDKRRTVAAYRFIRKFYDAALQHFPVLVGITKQKELHDLHLALGYRYVGEIPSLFDSVPAKIYAMTQESRREAPHGQFRKDKHATELERIHAPTPESVQQREADAEPAGIADSGRPEDWWSQQPASRGKRKRRSRARSVQPAHVELAESVSRVGPSE